MSGGVAEEPLDAKDQLDPREAQETEVAEQKVGGFSVVRLDEYGHDAIITEQALARLFGRHPASIKRAVSRGELPPPTRLLGGPVWTVGAIVRHIEKRLADAQRESEKLAKRVQELRP